MSKVSNKNKDKIHFFGSTFRKDDGAPGLAWDDAPAEVVARIVELLGEGKRFRITVQEDTAGKSPALLKYYYSVLLPDVQRGCRDMGNDWTIEETHRQLCDLLIEPDPETGVSGISGLDEQPFKIYVKRVIQFAAEFLHIAVRQQGGSDMFFPKN